MADFRIGYWDGTWKNDPKDYTLEQALREIKEADFEGVELGDPLSVLGTPDDLKKLLAEIGLEFITLSCPVEAPDARDRLDFAAEMGATVLMVGGGKRPKDRPPTAEDFKPYAEKVTALAEYGAKKGMKLAHHTHPGSLCGTYEEAGMLLGAAPLVGLCPDVAHLRQAGSDPVKTILDYRDRVYHGHLKDIDIAADELVELGEGDVDLPAVMDAFEKINFSGWLTVELDRSSRTPLESALISKDYLRKLGYP